MNIYNSSLGDGRAGIPENLPSLSTAWTKYYNSRRRNPEIKKLSSWLINRLEGKSEENLIYIMCFYIEYLLLNLGFSGLVESNRKREGVTSTSDDKKLES